MATVPLTNDWSSYSKLNAELESVHIHTSYSCNNANIVQLLPTLGGFQMVTPTTTLESMRALGANRPPSALWPEVLENDIQVPVRDGTWNAARVYTPSNSKLGRKRRALFVFIYGGGYVVGSITSEETNARNWVKRFGGVAISISYRYVLLVQAQSGRY
jgi:acetyl esterase/lipase